MLGLSLSAQIKGIVVDENNNPIPFVNIWVEGENIGTSSEENGQFIIHTNNENSRLIFNVLGYEKKTISAKEGKKVVLNKGSNVHYLLLKVLEANHLTLADIDVVYLPPADARAAFEKGAVDAWVIWDPFFAAAEQQLGAKVIANGQSADGKKLVNNYQFYLADRKFAEKHPDILKTVVNELNTTTQWVAQHQTDAAKLLEKPTGLPLGVLNTSIQRMGSDVHPISDEVAKEQQYVADAFYQQKLIPNKINIKAAILAN